MAPKKNEVRTLKPKEIIKNPDLALGATRKNVGKYKRLTAEYGNILPVVVCMQKSGSYGIISGSAGFDAYTEAGITEVPAVLSNLCDEKEQMKLSLMLSALPDESSALAEGVIISKLIGEHDLTHNETAKFIGKSRSWVSKRIALAERLADAVKRMVADGTLCARSAEEVAKFPRELQSEFATNAINAGLSKNSICALYKRYKNATDDATRLEIIKSPETALAKTPMRESKSKVAECGTPGRHLQLAANNAIRALLGTINSAEKAQDSEVDGAHDNLCRLQDIAENAAVTLNRITADFPRGNGGTHDD